jgi:hypothetical protein
MLGTCHGLELLDTPAPHFLPHLVAARDLTRYRLAPRPGCRRRHPERRQDEGRRGRAAGGTRACPGSACVLGIHPFARLRSLIGGLGDAMGNIKTGRS